MMIICPHNMHDITSIYASMYHGRGFLGTVLTIQSFSQLHIKPSVVPPWLLTVAGEWQVSNIWFGWVPDEAASTPRVAYSLPETVPS